MIVNRNLHQKLSSSKPPLSSCQYPHKKHTKKQTLKSKNKSKHLSIYNSQQEKRQVMDILNKIINIRVDKDMHYKLLRNRLEYAGGYHIQIQQQNIRHKSRIGSIILKYGNVIIKYCEILKTNPHYKFLSLIRAVIFKQNQLKEYIKGMQDWYQKQFIINLCKTDDTQNQSFPTSQNSLTEYFYAEQPSKIESKIDQQYVDKQNQMFHTLRQTKILHKQSQSTYQGSQIVINTYSILKQLNLDNLYNTISQSQDDTFVNAKSSLRQCHSYQQKIQYQFIHKQQQPYQLASLRQGNPDIIQFDLNKIVIVGIIENDYKKQGKYSILLIKQKQNQYYNPYQQLKQHFVLFINNKQICPELLKSIIEEYHPFDGYILNKYGIDLEEYWQENLEDQML